MSRVLVPAREEMDFYDIRTTLQALCAVYDNCNSLHTNAYDEAVTTPSAHSVRRVLAIQMIIDKEWGLAGNENPLQGSFILDQLTHRVSPGQRYRDILGRGGLQVADDSSAPASRTSSTWAGSLISLTACSPRSARRRSSRSATFPCPPAITMRLPPLHLGGSSAQATTAPAAMLDRQDLLGHRAPGS